MKEENKTKKQLISELLDLRRGVASFEALETSIADRKQVEERLKESEEKYRGLIEESLQGLVITQGIPPRLVFVNPAMTKILGYTSEELTALSPKEIEGLLYPGIEKSFLNDTGIVWKVNRRCHSTIFVESERTVRLYG